MQKNKVKQISWFGQSATRLAESTPSLRNLSPIPGAVFIFSVLGSNAKESLQKNDFLRPRLFFCKIFESTWPGHVERRWKLQSSCDLLGSSTRPGRQPPLCGSPSQMDSSSSFLRFYLSSSYPISLIRQLIPWSPGATYKKMFSNHFFFFSSPTWTPGTWALRAV